MMPLRFFLRLYPGPGELLSSAALFSFSVTALCLCLSLFLLFFSTFADGRFVQLQERRFFLPMSNNLKQVRSLLKAPSARAGLNFFIRSSNHGEYGVVESASVFEEGFASGRGGEAVCGEGEETVVVAEPACGSDGGDEEAGGGGCGRWSRGSAFVVKGVADSSLLEGGG